jgi:hypothetical protein
MKIFPQIFAGLLASTLLLTPCSLRADGGPVGPRFRAINPDPIGNLGPTAQGRLDAGQHSLDQALAALNRATGSKGPLLDQAIADLNQAKTRIVEATAYLLAHPEQNALPPGPAPAELPTVRPVTIPSGNRVPGVNLLAAVKALNTALGEFLNNPAPDSHTPVLGELGGNRDKIRAAIGLAAADVLIIIRSPSSAVYDNPPMLPTALASVALSLGLSAGGLYMLKRKKGRSVPHCPS